MSTISKYDIFLGFVATTEQITNVSKLTLSLMNENLYTISIIFNFTVYCLIKHFKNTMQPTRFTRLISQRRIIPQDILVSSVVAVRISLPDSLRHHHENDVISHHFCLNAAMPAATTAPANTIPLVSATAPPPKCSYSYTHSSTVNPQVIPIVVQ